MKICRYGEASFEKPGIFDRNHQLRDLSGIVEDITPESLPEVLSALYSEERYLLRLPEVDGSPRLGSPISTVTNSTSKLERLSS